MLAIMEKSSSPYKLVSREFKKQNTCIKVGEETGLPIVTEVLDLLTFDLVEKHTDIIQIGAGNMQNFSLLKRAGKAKKPILLKRGMSVY